MVALFISHPDSIRRIGKGKSLKTACFQGISCRFKRFYVFPPFHTAYFDALFATPKGVFLVSPNESYTPGPRILRFCVKEGPTVFFQPLF